MIEQRSQAWYKQKLGRLSSSEIWKLLTNPKTGTGLSETAKTYVMDKVAELLTDTNKDFYNDATIWGTQQEALAKTWTERMYNTTVEECEFLIHPEMPYYGGSPDGKMLIDAVPFGLEVKAPYNTTIHLKNIRYSYTAEDLKKYLTEHYWQMQSNMFLMDVGCFLFVTFDPRVSNDFGYVGRILERNEKDCNEMIASIDAAWDYYKDVAKSFGIDANAILTNNFNALNPASKND